MSLLSLLIYYNTSFKDLFLRIFQILERKSVFKPLTLGNIIVGILAETIVLVEHFSDGKKWLLILCGQPYLNFEFIADVAAIEFRADEFKLPVKQCLCVPVPVADQMQDLFIVCHGVNPCGKRQALSMCHDYSTDAFNTIRSAIHQDAGYKLPLTNLTNIIQQMCTNIQQ